MARGDGLRPGDSPFVVIELDSELRVVEWDARAERVFGATRAEAIGRAIDGLVPVDGGVAAWRALVVEADGATVRARTGDDRVFEWRRQQLRDAAGVVRGAVCFGCDVTAREAELRDKLAVIERQQQALHAMSTPIIEVWDGVLCLPILGLVDSVRTAEIMEGLLLAVTRVRARFAILDMTGVEVVDTSTAGHLIGLIRAIRLLGAEGIITGIHPNIAQTMVGLNVDLRSIVVHANLREALKHCIGRARPRAG